MCFLVEALGMSQPKISRIWLTCGAPVWFWRAGLVLARREGKWMHYRLKEPEDADLAAILAVASS